MLNTGDVLDQKYRVIRLIGEGGMGAVYEAEFEAIQRRVAIKVLFAGFANDPDAVLRFHREAQAAGRIGHDNICEVIDIGKLPVGSPYLVMPLLKGEPLAETIRRDAPLDIDRAVDLTSQVLGALGAAHRAQIVHRDLKPDNLFVTRLGDRGIEFVKVLDFGISKILGSASVNDQRQVTKTGMVLGTPSYMAPEQARGMKTVDQRADLYALGTILFEMLTGRRAFDGETYNEILIKVVVDPVPAPRALRPEIPLELEAVIIRAMQRDPAHRYQTAEEFRTELLLALDLVHGTGRHPTVEPTALAMAGTAAPATFGMPAGPSTAGPGPAAPGPVVSGVSVARTPDGTLAGRSSQTTVGVPRRRGRVIAALAGVLALLAAGLVFVLLRSGGHSTEDAGTPKAGPAAAAPRSAPAQPATRPPVTTVAAGVPTPSAPTGGSPSAGGPTPTSPGDRGSPLLLPDPHLAEHAADGAPDAGPSAVPVAVPAPDTVHLTFQGLPPNARLVVAGVPVEGSIATVPQAAAPTSFSIAAPGFEPYRDTVVPSQDRTVHVHMRHAATVAAAPRDAGASLRDAGGADAGHADGRTIAGRLGTMVVDDQEGPQP